MSDTIQDAGWGIALASHEDNRRITCVIAVAALLAAAMVVANLVAS